jgi:transposase
MASSVDIVRAKFMALKPVMDERMVRLWAGAEADALGSGGIAIVERATGMSRTTIRTGRDELREGVDPGDVVYERRAGGGRPSIEQTNPGIIQALESLVDPVTRGDPESPLRWTSKSTRRLAAELGEQGFQLSPQKVGQLLHASGYSLQSTKKTLEGTSHPDRNEQFEFINERVDGFHGDLGRHEEKGVGW